MYIDNQFLVWCWKENNDESSRVKNEIEFYSYYLRHFLSFCWVLTNCCYVLSVCPLSFPDTRHVAKKCANVISNTSMCCSAIDSYVSHLQNQSFVTNLQALNCAAALGMKLQRENVTENVYNLCHVSLKQFSVQGSLFLLHCFLFLYK